MTMPLIPGLAAGDQTAAAMTLTELLDSMTDADLTDLQALADEQASGGAATAGEAALDEDLSDGEGVSEEAGETLEDEEAETPEEQTAEASEGGGGEGYAELLQRIEERVTTATGTRDKIATLLEEATANEDVGGEPDEVQKLLDEAEDHLAEIGEWRDEAATAAEAQDSDAFASAGMKVEEHVQHLDALAQQAEAFASANEPTEEQAAALQAGQIPPSPALKLWAEKYLNR